MGPRSSVASHQPYQARHRLSEVAVAKNVIADDHFILHNWRKNHPMYLQVVSHKNLDWFLSKDHRCQSKLLSTATSYSHREGSKISLINMCRIQSFEIILHCKQ